MNRNKLKAYAPQARRDFIEAVTARAAHYGLTAKKTEPMTERGDVVLIAGSAFPKAVGQKRKKLEDRIRKQGFDQAMEACAYTWFNRLVAIRFMELHGYLDHGFRVLSPCPSGSGQAEGGVPEIVEQAEHVDLPGLDRQKVIELKLDGTKEEELYRLLLLAQCNALHKAMPFLFESIDDETELLLPDHLLHSDSLIRRLVAEIPEEDWQAVEIIGWLYQFYINERKDEVIGKVVKSEDIPAATQLFTPNWIVKYLVQNSLGRQWVATYPTSPLKGRMEYYIEPAEQTPEVQAKLAEITPKSLNPEELTLLDPACGSGHILVEAYDLLKAIYQERGYRAKDIPRLILEKNLFGLEIDDRAAQLAAFALLMKARADDRSIFERDVQPHVLSIQESKGLDAREITEALNQPILKEEPPPSGELFEEIAEDKSPLFSRKAIGVKGAVSQADVAHLISLFEHGKTFGSLIQVPESLADKLPAIAERMEAVIAHGGMFEKAAARTLHPLLAQSRLLAHQYYAVVTNPPYMGSGFYNPDLKQFVNTLYEIGKGDLYGAFIVRNAALARRSCFVAMITIPNWMFLSSFEQIRRMIEDRMLIESLVHNGRGIWGSDFGSCSFVLRKEALASYKGCFKRLFTVQGSVASNEELSSRFHTANRFYSSAEDFNRLPGSPIAYWISEALRDAFQFHPLSDFVETRIGLITGDNDYYIRRWYEVAIERIGFSYTREEARQSGKKWFPQSKGGDFRKWYGNHDTIVNWLSDGHELQTRLHSSGKRTLAHNFNLDKVFLPAITWTKISSSLFGARLQPKGFLFNDASANAFCDDEQLRLVALAYLCSKVPAICLSALNPTVNFLPGNISALPVSPSVVRERRGTLVRVSEECVQIARADWDAFETSWGFARPPLLGGDTRKTLANAHDSWMTHCSCVTERLRKLEMENNAVFREVYGLNSEIEDEVPLSHITLTGNPVYRYGAGRATEEYERLFRADTIRESVSYAVGCMMGRYSLDEPGLMYASSGNHGFDPLKYQKFPADEDGILPLTDFNWFADDTASRFEKFVATAWPAEHLEENLKFVADSLGPKNGESPRATIRRYLAADFFKHHLSVYKRRPIYWLFSSGKQRGFQALVYLHRYNEGTLARMRTEYVIPLLGKMTARIAQLTDDSVAATSSQHKKRLETEKATLVKQLAEVQRFDEKLRHYADQRIKLDLDDGVKVNYGKFGDLLAEARAVTGGGEEE